jgi:hypothetical protein
VQFLHGFGEGRRGRLVFCCQACFLFAGHFTPSIRQDIAGDVLRGEKVAATLAYTGVISSERALVCNRNCCQSVIDGQVKCYFTGRIKAVSGWREAKLITQVPGPKATLCVLLASYLLEVT